MEKLGSQPAGETEAAWRLCAPGQERKGVLPLEDELLIVLLHLLLGRIEHAQDLVYEFGVTDSSVCYF